jgi:catechol 2,3-dioxygenase
VTLAESDCLGAGIGDNAAMDTTIAPANLATRAPLHVGAYALTVRDLDVMKNFYRRVIGLDVMAETARTAVLGNDGAALLHLEQRDGLQPDDKATAGLFHTAFVMPRRKDLAAWLVHARSVGMDINRTGDHLVNEALYFDDPEGNGCECYSDRPPETWVWDEAGHVDIDTGKKVDLDALAREADSDGYAWHAPRALRIGHINIRVGDYTAGERFYRDAIGLDFTGRRHIDFAGRPNTIAFMSSGRYHHHLAVNDFTSRGAGPRDPDRAGLAWFAFAARDSATLAKVRARLAAAGVPMSEVAGGIEARDPWGTPVRVVLADN